MGASVEFIIAKSVVQQGGTMCSKEGPDMAAINSLGGPHILPQTVPHTHITFQLSLFVLRRQVTVCWRVLAP